MFSRQGLTEEESEREESRARINRQKSSQEDRVRARARRGLYGCIAKAGETVLSREVGASQG